MAGVEDEGEVAALRDALRQQTLAVEKLRAELEEERHAASSGADEALAMILRLQAEKAAERMEAEQFRRVAEERIHHDEDSLAFLKAVVFHQDMEISSLKHRLLAVCVSNDPFASAAGGDGAFDLPWLRRMAKNGVPSRRNASLPAVHLEELCSTLDLGGAGDDDYSRKNGGDRRPARTVSDIGEVIRREKEFARSNVSHQPPPPLHRSASHRLRRVPSYSAQCVHDKFEAPESVAAHVPPTSSRRASPEIISEEEDLISSTPRSDDKPRNDRISSDHINIAELGADIEQIKVSIENLETELIRIRETSTSRGDAQARLLAEICARLDAMQKQKNVEGDKRSDPVLPRKSIREEGTCSNKRGSSSSPAQSELLMNHFIEVCAIVFSALLARPLLKVAASLSFLRCLLILLLAAMFRKALVNS